MNYSTYSCNQNIDEVSLACSCADCDASCPAPVPYPPPKQHWKLFGFYGYMVIAAAVFIAVAAVFLGVMLADNVYKYSRNRRVSRRSRSCAKFFSANQN